MTGGRLPKVLVLMTTYNGTRWVGEQVRSIAAQHGVQVALAFRDDHSTDTTIAEVYSAARGVLPLIEISAEQRSGSASRNFFRLMRAVEVAGYDFVALADHDDIWDTDKLERATRILSASDAVGYSAAVRAFWPNGRAAILGQSPLQTEADFLFEGAGQGCTFVMKAHFFQQWQLVLEKQSIALDALHYHDWAIYAYCRMTGQQWQFDRRTCMEYRQHAENDTGARGSMAALKKRIALIHSGWYGKQIKAISRLSIVVCESKIAVRYLNLLDQSHKAFTARCTLVYFILRYGRRRRSDRFALALIAFFGLLG